jgi:hypothetical protein
MFLGWGGETCGIVYRVAFVDMCKTEATTFYHTNWFCWVYSFKLISTPTQRSNLYCWGIRLYFHAVLGLHRFLQTNRSILNDCLRFQHSDHAGGIKILYACPYTVPVIKSIGLRVSQCPKLADICRCTISDLPLVPEFHTGTYQYILYPFIPFRFSEGITLFRFRFYTSGLQSGVRVTFHLGAGKSTYI